ncbi:MAG: glycosyltransferase, partial [Nitrospirota bacterium]|nr:glycosyltransferase [Nitrospirota bacterium]
LEALLRFRDKAKKNSQPKEKKQTAATQKTNPKKTTLFQNLKDFISTLLRFPDAEIGWVPWAILRALKTYKQQKIKVFYTSGPPHSCHLVGWALQKLTGLPWVADFRDPWTRQGWIHEATKKTWHHRWKMALERRVVASANRVILNTNEMRDDFADFYPNLPSEKFTAIYNGFDPEDVLPLPPKPENEKIFIITHAGSLYKKRTPLGLLKALSALIDEKKIVQEEIRIRLIGRCEIDEVQEEIDRLGLTSCVERIAWVTHEESLQAIAASDLLLLIQPGTRLQIPGKIFEYIMLKKNILALTDDGATSSIVKNYELGAVAQPMDIPEIKQALLQCYKNRSHSNILSSGYQRALETFNAQALTKQLEETFQEVILEHDQ